jgi:hypothetical protein
MIDVRENYLCSGNSVIGRIGTTIDALGSRKLNQGQAQLKFRADELYLGAFRGRFG